MNVLIGYAGDNYVARLYNERAIYLAAIERVKALLDRAEECGDGATAELVADIRQALEGDYE